MLEEIIIAGFGGQGVLSVGTLAYAAMVEGKEISWMPSYGRNRAEPQIVLYLMKNLFANYLNMILQCSTSLRWISLNRKLSPAVC
jgi:hypothetical protein